MIRVDIVGGGVSGLALAGALDPSRFRVRLHETNPGFIKLGTVLGMWPAAMRALRTLGVDDQVRALGVPVESAHLCDSSGRRLTFHSAPGNSWLIPRPDLLAILEKAIPAEVEWVHGKVTDLSQLTGDLVVGSDGVRSMVRDTVFGRTAHQTGVMAFRGIVDGPVEQYSPGQRGLVEYWGGGALFGMSPNTRGVTNWYAATREFEVTPQQALDWSREKFADFPAPVAAVLAAADPRRTLVNRVLEAPMLTSLVRDRYVLVGDSAHAMAPNLGRGACEALVDAAVLAKELSTQPLERALRRYNERRLVAGQAVKLASAAVCRAALAWP